MGSIEGLTFHEIEVAWPSVAASLLAGDGVDWPAGERHADLVGRVLDAWSRRLATGRPAVVVTHGGPLRIVLQSLGLGPAHLEPGTIVRIRAGAAEIVGP